MKLSDIMKMEPEEIKETYNHIREDIEAQDEADKYFYAYYKITGKEPVNQPRYENLRQKFEAEVREKREAPNETEQKDRRQFAKIMYDAIDNKDWLRKNRNKTGLYLVLLRYICRGPIKNDKHDIYNRYYMNNKLACCVGVDLLAYLFGYADHRHICRMLDELEKEGAFVVERIPQKAPMKPKKVYVLGEFRGGKEHYYYK